MQRPYIPSLKEKADMIDKVSTNLDINDIYGAIKCRWSINRNKYIVKPGIYALGNPDASSLVFVTANYKISFDILRKNLSGINCWILVLDTKGINVWCAAGKGTFGTDELVAKIITTGLTNIINHRKIIVPQLGATGISAHKVKEHSGFSVIYGPVRAEDINKFISNKFKADDEMRTVRFNISDRAKLIPVELVGHFKYLLLAAAILLLLSGFGMDVYSIDRAAGQGLISAFYLFTAYLTGCILLPLLLPWIPGTSFSLKGFITGFVVSVIVLFLTNNNYFELQIYAWLLIMSAISSFISMNFTGSSTYTSLSGVLKEMKIAIPVQIIFVLTGIVLLVVYNFKQ
ncbi:MAG: acetyl-CoA synthase subunit gamma [Bacteroidia bacterium]|nr:acetyl-CoA synthase subunit gamma [Bacteroidia bacterium]